MALPFRPSQVDDLHLAEDDVLGVGGVDLLQHEGEDGVGAGAAEVHLVGADDLVAETEVEERQDLLVGGALEGEEVLHGVDVLRVPLQLEALGTGAGVAAESQLGLELEHACVEQVVDLLVVDLHERYIDGNLPVRPGQLDLLYEQLGTALDHAQVVLVLLDLGHVQPLLIGHILVPLHGVGLAGASLAVGEDGGVEPFHHLAYHVGDVRLLEQLRLRRMGRQHLVEPVAFSLRTLLFVFGAYPISLGYVSVDYSISLVSSRYLMLGYTWVSSDSPSR